METQAMMDGHLRYKKKPLNLYSNIKAAMCWIFCLYLQNHAFPCFSTLLCVKVIICIASVSLINLLLSTSQLFWPKESTRRKVPSGKYQREKRELSIYSSVPSLLNCSGLSMAFFVKRRL